jgi:hypothetical protein
MTRSLTKYFTELFIALFLGFFAIFALGIFGVAVEPNTTDFFVENPLGWFIIFMTGGFALVFSIVMVIFWMTDMKFKDLRYKMAFFLYHSKVKNGERIPLPYLARVAVCTEPEITQTLNIMIAKDELKGRIDEEERLYIHKTLTRRGMRFLMALPPAGVRGLKEVRKWALKGHVWGAGNEEEDDFEYVEELEEMDAEELPPALEIIQKSKEKLPCPHCGRMNIKDHQFCTFCGEVI